MQSLHSPGVTKRLLGERLLESGLVDERQLAHALQAQQSTGEQLGSLLVRLGYLSEDDLLHLLCEEAGIPFSRLEEWEVEPDALAAISESVALAHTALALRDRDGRLHVALADPFDMGALTSLERAVGRRVAPVGASRKRIEALLERFHRVHRHPAEEEGGDSVAVPSGIAATGTAGRIADEVFERGIAAGATDIHIEPAPDAVRVRYRLDGILRDGPSYPKSMQSALVTRIKVLAGLNIAESRLPQDGRLRIDAGGHDVDLRISTFPTLHGEDMVLRVLDRSRRALQLDSLGMPAEDLAIFREVLGRPLGFILLTGPTGSGKTTTLYSALAELNSGERCILTLEDPIEYEIDGIRQSQINPRAGLTFSSGLRSMLRHDPDIILVGEIRDEETAQICISAAMTGHLVLSTLHTDTAASAITRLLDIGAEPFALAASLKLSIAQRLVRLLCPACREPTDVPSVVRRRFELGDTTLYRAGGCPACNGTGYRGRAAIFEMLPVTQGISDCIYERQSADEIRRRVGRPSLFQSGLAKVRSGQTSLEELLRVVSA